MSELGISAAARNTIMQDIFGNEGKKEKGLIDDAWMGSVMCLGKAI